MRVLLTTDTIGGVWTFTKELTTGLLDLSHAIALVSFGRRPSEEQTAWCKNLEARYPASFRYIASELPLEWMQSNNLAYADGAALLQQIAHEFKAELLHSNQFCFGRVPLSIPRLVTAHSDVFSWAESCKPEVLTPSEWLLRYRTLVQQGLGGAHMVVAPTRWMLDALSRNFRLPSNTRVCPNGRALPYSPCNRERTLQAVSAGRLWDEAKGLSILSGVRAPFPILLAGESHHEHSRLHASIGQVTLLGSLAQDQLFALFRSSAIYLATSIYEPFGLAPLEAALCGCALLAYDIPSLREVWGDAALYFRDASTLAHLLEELDSDPDLLKHRQSCSLRRASQLTAERMTRRYLALYQELLQTQPPLVALSTRREVHSHAS